MKPHVAKALAERLSFQRPVTSDNFGVLRHGDKELLLKELGSGDFADVYRNAVPPHEVYSFVSDEVDDKRVLEAVHKRNPDNPHIPKTEFIGRLPREKQNVYRMPYYKVGTPRNSSAEAEQARLSVCAAGANGDGLKDSKQRAEVVRCAKHWSDLDVRQSTVNSLELLSKEAAKHRRAKYAFEFPSKNVATDAAGNLVLLDVLYDTRFG